MTAKKQTSRVTRKRNVRRRLTGESVLDAANPHSVASSLYGQDKQPDSSRLNDRWVHVSNHIHGGCLRAKLIARFHGTKELTNTPRPADRLLWRIGRAVEAHIRESMIAIYGMENTLGAWECRCGATRHVGYGEPDARCERCTGAVSHYYEYLVQDIENMLTGSPDLLIRDHNGKLVVFEIKSIKAKANSKAPAFENIETPIRGHQLQALMYHRMLSMGYEMSDHVVILYGAKDYMFKSPYKAFSVDATEGANTSTLDLLYEAAGDYRRASDAKRLLPRLPVCNTPKAQMARECPLCSACFALD